MMLPTEKKLHYQNYAELPTTVFVTVFFFFYAYRIYTYILLLSNTLIMVINKFMTTYT